MPPADVEVYLPVPLPSKAGHPVDPAEQEEQMPATLRLQVSAEIPATVDGHLVVVWWHQRGGEPDEFMRIAYDTLIDSSFMDISIPFSSLELPVEENLICWRACRDRSICLCEADEQFALASVLVAIDKDGDGALSLDELRSEQIGGTPAVIGWSPMGMPRFDGALDVIHQGFATYVLGQESQLLEAVTAAEVAATLAFCAPGDHRCSFPVQRIYCNSPSCYRGRDWGLNRFGF